MRNLEVDGGHGGGSGGVPSLARDRNDVAARLQVEGDSRGCRWVRADVGGAGEDNGLVPGASVGQLRGENRLRAADGASFDHVGGPVAG